MRQLSVPQRQKLALPAPPVCLHPTVIAYGPIFYRCLICYRQLDKDIDGGFIERGWA